MISQDRTKDQTVVRRKRVTLLVRHEKWAPNRRLGIVTMCQSSESVLRLIMLNVVWIGGGLLLLGQVSRSDSLLLPLLLPLLDNDECDPRLLEAA